MLGFLSLGHGYFSIQIDFGLPDRAFAPMLPASFLVFFRSGEHLQSASGQLGFVAQICIHSDGHLQGRHGRFAEGRPGFRASRV